MTQGASAHASRATCTNGAAILSYATFSALWGAMTRGYRLATRATVSIRIGAAAFGSAERRATSLKRRPRPRNYPLKLQTLQNKPTRRRAPPSPFLALNPRDAESSPRARSPRPRPIAPPTAPPSPSPTHRSPRVSRTRSPSRSPLPRPHRRFQTFSPTRRPRRIRAR